MNIQFRKIDKRYHYYTWHDMRYVIEHASVKMRKRAEEVFGQHSFHYVGNQKNYWKNINDRYIIDYDRKNEFYRLFFKEESDVMIFLLNL